MGFASAQPIARVTAGDGTSTKADQRLHGCSCLGLNLRSRIGEMSMHCDSLRIAAVTLAALTVLVGAAPAADDAKYPDWTGAWGRFVVRGLGGQPSFDQTKPWGRSQEAPLTAEYQKVLEDSLADQAKGGQGNFIDHALCHPAGMPFMMVATRPLEFVIAPHTTYILVGGSDHYRRIFTDGRKWPETIEPSYSGYSIGRWIDG